MSDRQIFCVYLKRISQALSAPPYPGVLGERLYQEISQEAWSLWQEKQTMLINENRLSMLNPDHRQQLEQWMIQFLFEGQMITPTGYIPLVADSSIH